MEDKGVYKKTKEEREAQKPVKHNHDEKLKELKDEIDVLRKQLNDEIIQGEDVIIDKKLIDLSKRLDELIAQYVKEEIYQEQDDK